MNKIKLVEAATPKKDLPVLAQVIQQKFLPGSLKAWINSAFIL